MGAKACEARSTRKEGNAKMMDESILFVYCDKHARVLVHGFAIDEKRVKEVVNVDACKFTCKSNFTPQTR